MMHGEAFLDGAVKKCSDPAGLASAWRPCRGAAQDMLHGAGGASPGWSGGIGSRPRCPGLSLAAMQGRCFNLIWHGAGHFLALRARALLAALPSEAEDVALLRGGVGPDLELCLRLRQRKGRALAAAVQAGMPRSD